MFKVIRVASTLPSSPGLWLIGLPCFILYDACSEGHQCEVVCIGCHVSNEIVGGKVVKEGFGDYKMLFKLSQPVKFNNFFIHFVCYLLYLVIHLQ